MCERGSKTESDPESGRMFQTRQRNRKSWSEEGGKKHRWSRQEAAEVMEELLRRREKKVGGV